MSFNFSLIAPLAVELAPLWASKKDRKICNGSEVSSCCPSALLVRFILFSLAGKKNKHKSYNELAFQPDQTLNCGVSCPWVSGKISIDLQWEKCWDHSYVFIFNGSFSFLLVSEKLKFSFAFIFMRSFSFWQVMSTTMKAWMSLNFNKIIWLTS